MEGKGGGEEGKGKGEGRGGRKGEKGVANLLNVSTFSCQVKWCIGVLIWDNSCSSLEQEIYQFHIALLTG